MELYTLDASLRRIAVIDRWESLLWAERFADTGDFKLVVPTSTKMLNLLPKGTLLAMNDSHRVMVVETIEKKRSGGKATMTVTGRSLEKLLIERVARPSWDDLDTTPTWDYTDVLPADICRDLFDKICIQGVLHAGDIIPTVSATNIFPTDTIAEPADTISLEIPPKTLFQAIKDIADLHELGFRLVRDHYNNVLYFNIYAGSDRTTQQSTYAPVIFSENLDNFTDATELSTIETARDAAYVFAGSLSLIVYADDASDDTTGFDRQVLYVDASDIENPTTALLEARGKEELAAYRGLEAFDGEINEYAQYKYGVDYYLGDMIEARNAEGFTNVMRVTEQIFVSDSSGEKSYPTLTINTSITPGSWSSWDYNAVWADYSDTEYWADQP